MLKTSELTLSANSSYTWTQSGLRPERGRWRIEGNRLFMQREKPTKTPVRKVWFLVRNGTLVLDPDDICPGQGLDEYFNPLVMRKE